MNEMENDTLFEEQRDFLRTHKDQLFDEYKGIKVGFDLNIPVYFTHVLLFELRKHYETIHPTICSDRFIEEELGDVMDRAWVQKGDDFSLKDSFKNEVKLALITNYMIHLSKGMSPATIANQTTYIERAAKEAHRIIDSYFENTEVNYSEIEDIVDIFEVLVANNGQEVGLFIGNHRFSLNEGEHVSELLDYTTKQREMMQEKRIFATEQEEHLRVLKQRVLRNVQTNLKPMLQKTWKTTFDTYQMKALSLSTVKEMFVTWNANLEVSAAFFKTAKEQQITLPKETTLMGDYVTVRIDAFSFDLRKGTPKQFVQQYAAYRANQSFIQSMKEKITEAQYLCETSVKGNALIVKAEHRTSKTMQQLDQSKRPRPVEMKFLLEQGGVYRVTGEQVLTEDAVVYQIMEALREGQKQFELSIKRAKEMFLATLTEEEEALFNKENITIIEGKENFYALLDKRSSTHNNVIKIPKNMASADEMRALCIHPEDRHVPMFDGFAAIALSIKSEDEDYVLANSNEFTVSKTIKQKLQNVFNQYQPLKHVQLA